MTGFRKKDRPGEGLKKLTFVWWSILKVVLVIATVIHSHLMKIG